MQQGAWLQRMVKGDTVNEFDGIEETLEISRRKPVKFQN